MAETLPSKMKAVIFQGPKHVTLEERPVPVLKDATDVIVRVHYTALCGSELHVFRGHQKSGTGFIMGHEFTGRIVQVGSAVTKWRVNDHVVSPFTVSCGECFFCQHGATSRCAKSALFGSVGLDGAQAEYVRVPLADATLVGAPANLDPKLLVLMADIFPTGFFATYSAFWGSSPRAIAGSGDEIVQRGLRGSVVPSQAVVVVIGCGPVGLCALVNARRLKPRALLAVDRVASRTDLAKKLGAEAWQVSGKEEEDALLERVRALTDGRGADVVIEVVGLSPALRTAFDLLRPFGTLASVGVHNAEIPWTAAEAYHKNLRHLMGRCPVRSVFDDALEALIEVQGELGFMADHIVPLDQAVEGYRIFDSMQVQKVIFEIPEI